MGMETSLWSSLLPSMCCKRPVLLLLDSGGYKQDVMHRVFLSHSKGKMEVDALIDSL